MSDLSHSASSTRPSSGLAASLVRRLTGVMDTLSTWNERRRQRMALEALPDHLLSDIGISRADADHEGDKPFWRS